MPYRVDVPAPSNHTLEQLISLGALDVAFTETGRGAAILPDSVSPKDAARALGLARVAVSAAVGRDDGSVWVVSPPTLSIGRLVIAPTGVAAPPPVIRLTDSGAFGTGLHPTTALCVEAMDDAVSMLAPDRLLDIGTGSGILALAALALGVPSATGTDTDGAALTAAAVNAELNGLTERLTLVRGGPDATDGAWPVVVANIAAAPLIEMAPLLIRRVGHDGLLILSGIPRSVAENVVHTYRRLGLHHVRSMDRAGWTALTFRASW